MAKKYQIIGGQYETRNYGESDSLEYAKRIARRNPEYWDNWQGWHIPKIYRTEDTEEIITRGWITYNDGELLRVPKDEAEPVWQTRG